MDRLAKISKNGKPDTWTVGAKCWCESWTPTSEQIRYNKIRGPVKRRRRRREEDDDVQFVTQFILSKISDSKIAIISGWFGTQQFPWVFISRVVQIRQTSRIRAPEDSDSIFIPPITIMADESEQRFQLVIFHDKMKKITPLNIIEHAMWYLNIIRRKKYVDHLWNLFRARRCPRHARQMENHEESRDRFHMKRTKISSATFWQGLGRKCIRKLDLAEIKWI
jgi:hypothetical protein